MEEPRLTGTLQIALVVRDLAATMRTYVHEYGIGPWEIYEFNPRTVRNMQQDGQPVETAWRIALARVGHVHWELIQPLDDVSTFAQFLAGQGEGVHHVAVGVPSFEGALATLAEQGRTPVASGEYNGVNFAYLPTGGELGVITEIFDRAPEGQKPDAVYP